jgi:hypothetical protein
MSNEQKQQVFFFYLLCITKSMNACVRTTLNDALSPSGLTSLDFCYLNDLLLQLPTSDITRMLSIDQHQP